MSTINPTTVHKTATAIRERDWLREAARRGWTVEVSKDGKVTLKK